MVADIRTVPYLDEHGDYIAANIRHSDRKEIYYLAAMKPAAAVKTTMASAVVARTVMVDNLPAVIFGVSRRSFLSDVGVPWLLGTPVAEEHQFRFGRETRDHCRRMMTIFPVMENYALAENTRTVRWLKWAGFDIEDARPFGAFGAPFVRFGKGLSCA